MFQIFLPEPSSSRNLFLLKIRIRHGTERRGGSSGGYAATRSTFRQIHTTFLTYTMLRPPAGPAGAVIPGVTLEELRGACTRIRDGAAPGPDGVPNRALKLAVVLRPDAFLKVYSACLSGGIFPSPWKRQRLVLLPKPGRPPDAPSSYRPLCMLDTAGKILERIICRRLEEYTEAPDGLSDHQHGFRRGRSTVDAIESVTAAAREAVGGARGSRKYCAIVTLEVRNAFNSARLDDGVRIVGFADNIDVVTVAGTTYEVEDLLSRAIARVRDALWGLGLETADHKTEALLLSRKRRLETITIEVGDCFIASSPCIRYLGIQMDARLTFNDHLRAASQKASKVAGALSQIMPTIGGPRSSRRRLYANVTDSILLYGAPIWSCGAGTRAGMRRAEAIHRRACLRVISGRPHLSYDATYVLASIPPLALLADERSRLYQRRHEDARAEERQETLRRWQSRWDRSPKGRWTHRLIPNISIILTHICNSCERVYSPIRTGIFSFLPRLAEETSLTSIRSLCISVAYAGSYCVILNSPTRCSKRERLRPPTYNAEDYTQALRRWGRRALANQQQQHHQHESGNHHPHHHHNTLPSTCTSTSSSGYASAGNNGEMTLRQFTSVSELLNKLKADLKLAFPSFVQEFVSAPGDGISLLLETLRGVQLSQSTPPSATGPRRPRARRAAMDELGCVECLAACADRCPDAGRLLAQAQPGLLALACCLTSSLNRSRVIALQ
ncbi:unnamed protein product, partial [Trichogramma brassicae]